MKKFLIAFAACGTVSGMAVAQSNVTVYGIIDASVTHSQSEIAPSKLTVDSGNWYGSRLGFRGSEDLGDGLSAIFQLENGFSVDTGAAGQSGRLFGRHAWVGLKGGFGTVRIGRSWTPAYCALTDTIDPFEDGMAGAAAAFFGRNVFNAIDIRMQNAIFYTSPTVGGMTGEIAYALGEVAGNSKAGSQLSTVLTYVGGRLRAVASYNDMNNATGTGSAKLYFGGARYDFGPFKLHLGLDRQKTDNAGVLTTDANDVLVALTVPVGRGTFLASYNYLNDRSKANADMKQAAVGYKYELSKRTTLYTSYGHINVNDANRFMVGIRHRF
jgi:predicted porin